MSTCEKVYTGSLEYYINSVSGIWNSYGCIPDEGNSISLRVEDSSLSDYSLADLCGFDRSRKDIGQLQERKILEELIVMIPMMQEDIKYTQKPAEPPIFTPPADKCAPCDEMVDPCEDIQTIQQEPPQKEKFKGLTYCKTEDAWLFTINPDLINKILGVDDYKNVYIGAVEELIRNNTNLNQDNNIVKLMKCMAKYNIPPHLNWLAFPKTVPPYAFYVAEFSSELDKKDLGDIWQGTMPNIAQNPEEEEITIEHYLTSEEIFGGYDITEYEDIKLKIFKCKKRAKSDYYRDLIKNTNTFNVPKPWYQYNWPYDNFSLVELLKVEAGEVHEFNYDGVSDGGVITRTFTTPDGSQVSFNYQVTPPELSDMLESINTTNQSTKLYMSEQTGSKEPNMNKLYDLNKQKIAENLYTKAGTIFKK